MKYNISTINNIRKYEETDFMFFWGHKPLKNGEISNSCFSQWWKCAFYEDGLIFNCAEQYMMYRKAILFEDYEMAFNILNNNNPKDIKAYGRKVSNFNEKVWDENKEQIVLKGNILKFSQNSPLKDYLLNTKEKILVEASPYDKVWGIGMKEDSPGIANINNWQGLNLLGFALMETRERLENI